MQIIDFSRKGNVVRFYLGENTREVTGDDWDDAPYSCNAGTVYDEYVKGIKDIPFPFDDLVLEPSSGAFNEPYSKEDMQKRIIPCIIVVPKELTEDSWYDDFEHWKGADGVKKFYFGDEIE